ncbi:cholesterol esterase [Solihabitans fulvus]|uniref:Cholesterol esterase n=1 Tax=Solihabitans fulvus TaxID=1892852 RepID=A0A5B2X8P4_9PSEU|nr:DUF6230 family protein [Solihabitans fulvus]KAA2259501.1 cholesterol esterase [Solihabitans fulvus]
MTENETAGRTRWTRFAAVLGAGAVGAGVLMFGLSQGAFAASFAVSGQSFKVSADTLDGSGYVQYGSVDRTETTDANGKPVTVGHAVAVNGFKSATLGKFCQSVYLTHLPFIGDATMRIEAPGADGMHAENMVVDLTELNGDLTLTNPHIGVDAGSIGGAPNSFGLTADSAKITNLQQTAWATTAQTITFKGMHLGVATGKNECFGN